MILTRHGFAYDIVYLVKNERVNEELRYSLRTVEKNFPHNEVWFYGGCPDDLRPDHHCWQDQNWIDGPKWYKTTTMLARACRNPQITEWFWLFNDDFFITEPAPAEFQALYHGTMKDRIKEIVDKCGGSISPYSEMLRRAQYMLENANMPTLNYATHTPLLINRECALEVLAKFPKSPMFRCLYGNFFEIGGIDGPDVKVSDVEEEWDERSWCMSTSDTAFMNGKAGKFIRDRFAEPCRWEVRP